MRRTGIWMGVMGAIGVTGLACAGGGPEVVEVGTAPAAAPPAAEPAPAPAPPTEAPAEPDPPAQTAAGPMDACSVGGVVLDDDPAGLNVRAEPKGPVLGQIPHHAMVQIDGARDGWLHLSEVWSPEDEDATWPLGWVHGSMVGTWMKSPVEYGPDMVAHLYDRKDGEITWTFPGDKENTPTYLGCDGLWIRAKVPGSGRTGWLHPDQHCPNTVTTCS